MDAPNSPDNQEPTLREHAYDGIQEYDQKLPNWWLWSWYITMIWFVLAWLIYYQLGVGRDDAQRMAEDLAKIEEVRQKELEKIDDAKLWAMSQDEAVVAKGKETFMTTCVACHAADLSAHLAGNKLPGLPLNDQEWKHGGNPTQVLNLVRKGAPDITKGMPAWEPQLGLDRVVDVVAFVMSHHKEGEPQTLAADSPLKAEAK
ncbi:MAG: c-type cytochrome [Verrucomicrobiales bacterium]|nr:c-type cytochrome [Verrucomicrobiales bacterium]